MFERMERSFGRCSGLILSCPDEGPDAGHRIQTSCEYQHQLGGCRFGVPKEPSFAADRGEEAESTEERQQPDKHRDVHPDLAFFRDEVREDSRDEDRDAYDRWNP